MACQTYTTGALSTGQISAGQQQAAASSESGGSLIILSFIGLLGLMYFVGKK